MATWPNALPDKIIADGYKESPPDNLIRTQMDKGAAKIRRRTTSNPRVISCQDIYTLAQVEILDQFYLTDLASGSLRFDWTHPRTGAAAEMRFKEKPTYEKAGGKFQVSFTLEVFP